MIGIVNIKSFKNIKKRVGETNDSYGYYLRDGKACNNDKIKMYGEQIMINDIITCEYNTNNNSLGFYINGDSLGIAYKNIKNGKYAFAVTLYNTGDCIEIVNLH